MNTAKAKNLRDALKAIVDFLDRAANESTNGADTVKGDVALKDRQARMLKMRTACATACKLLAGGNIELPPTLFDRPEKKKLYDACYELRTTKSANVFNEHKELLKKMLRMLDDCVSGAIGEKVALTPQFIIRTDEFEFWHGKDNLFGKLTATTRFFLEVLANNANDQNLPMKEYEGNDGKPAKCRNVRDKLAKQIGSDLVRLLVVNERGLGFKLGACVKVVDNKGELTKAAEAIADKMGYDVYREKKREEKAKEIIEEEYKVYSEDPDADEDDGDDKDE